MLGHYTLCLKKMSHLVLSISLTIINRFLKFFRWHALYTISYKAIIEYRTTL